MKKLVEQYLNRWSVLNSCGYLRNRSIPKQRRDDYSKLWQKGALSAEDKLFVFKWFVGKFPIPERHNKILREISARLRMMILKETH